MISGSVVRVVILEVSIAALSAKAEPVSRWHPEVLAAGTRRRKGVVTTAVTTVDDERLDFHAIFDIFAITTPF